MSAVHGSRRRRRAGFTLIELVVVLIIIATIAGFVIPQIGMLGRTSDMAATAKTQADLAHNLQLFFTLQKRYPQGLDSLVTTTGAIFAATPSDALTQTTGLPYAGADGTRLEAQLSPWAIDNSDTPSGVSGGSFRSFSRSGFDWIYNHNPAVYNANNSTVGMAVVTVTTGITVAEVTGTALLAKLVPQGLVTGERIVALGVGPRNTAISKTLTNCPTYPGADGKYYGRFIAYFKVYASGERCVLIGTSDSYGRTPDYSQQQFNESLPDGGRQG